MQLSPITERRKETMTGIGAATQLIPAPAIFPWLLLPTTATGADAHASGVADRPPVAPGSRPLGRVVHHPNFTPRPALPQQPLAPALASLVLLIRPDNPTTTPTETTVLVDLPAQKTNVPVTFVTTDAKRAPTISDRADLCYDQASATLLLGSADYTVHFEPSGVPLLINKTDTDPDAALKVAQADLQRQIQEQFNLHHAVFFHDLEMDVTPPKNMVVWQGLTLRDGTQIKMAVRHNGMDWELVQEAPAGKRFGRKDIAVSLCGTNIAQAIGGYATCAVAPYKSSDPAKDPLAPLQQNIDEVRFNVSSQKPLVFYFRRDTGIFVPAESNLHTFARHVPNCLGKLSDLVLPEDFTVPVEETEETLEPAVEEDASAQAATAAEAAAAAAAAKEAAVAAAKAKAANTPQPETTLEDLFRNSLLNSNLPALLTAATITESPELLELRLVALDIKLTKDPSRFAIPGVRELYIRLRLALLDYRDLAEMAPLVAQHQLATATTLDDLSSAIANRVPPKIFARDAKNAAGKPSGGGSIKKIGALSGGAQDNDDEEEKNASGGLDDPLGDLDDPLDDDKVPGDIAPKGDALPPLPTVFKRSEADALYVKHAKDNVVHVLPSNVNDKAVDILGVKIEDDDGLFNLYFGNMCVDRESGLILWTADRDAARFYDNQHYVAKGVSLTHLTAIEPANIEVVAYPNNWLNLIRTLQYAQRNSEGLVVKPAVVQEIWMQIEIKKEKILGREKFVLVRNTRIGSAPDSRIIGYPQGRNILQHVYEDPTARIGKKWQASSGTALRAAENRRAFNDAGGYNGTTNNNKGRLEVGAYFHRVELMAGSPQRAHPSEYTDGQVWALLASEINNARRWGNRIPDPHPLASRFTPAQARLVAYARKNVPPGVPTPGIEAPALYLGKSIIWMGVDGVVSYLKNGVMYFPDAPLDSPLTIQSHGHGFISVGGLIYRVLQKDGGEFFLERFNDEFVSLIPKEQRIDAMIAGILAAEKKIGLPTGFSLFENIVIGYPAAEPEKSILEKHFNPAQTGSLDATVEKINKLPGRDHFKPSLEEAVNDPLYQSDEGKSFLSAVGEFLGKYGAITAAMPVKRDGILTVITNTLRDRARLAVSAGVIVKLLK